MERFAVGEIVLLRFPFTDAEGSKRRPALVLFDAGDADVIVARVTGQERNSTNDIRVEKWEQAGLLLPSTVRLHKVATLEKSLVERRLGELSEEDWKRVRAAILEMWKTI